MLNKEKLNANPVGVAAHSDPQTNKTTKFNCRGGRLCPPANKQNGITLIALIITIIVMLILVGVTINVALNGGIFEKAKNAKEQTQVRTNEEALYAAAVGAYNEVSGKVDFTKLNAEATKLGFTVKSNGVYEKDGYTYTVNETTGIVTATKITSGGGGGSSSEVPEDLATYILGTDGTGRDLISEMSANGILSMSTMIFGQDPLNPSSTLYQDVKFAYIGDDNETIYIRYGRDVYSFKMTMVVDDNDTPDDDSDDTQNYLTVANSLNYERTPEGNLGKYVTYNGDTWIVLSDDSSGVELISANATGSVTLGGSTFENARTSYNSAVSTIISACGGTGSNNIRSVGGPASDTTTTTVDFSELTTFEQSVDDTNFAQYEGVNGLKIGDENYLTDYNKMKAIGILATDTPAEYWLASRFVEENSNDVYFSMRYVYNVGSLDYDYLCNVYSDAGTNFSSPSSYAVRPVVTLNSGALGDVAEGVGTRTNPIEL